MKSLLHIIAILMVAANLLATERVGLPEYRVGETARVDVIAPFTLTAVDPQKTAELKSKEAARVPIIFRFDTNAAAAVTQQFHSRIAEERVRFLDALLNEYKRAALDERAVNNQRFRKLVTSLQDSNNPFPLTIPLARIWATNGDDSVFIGDVQKHFEELAASYLRRDPLPEDWKNQWQLKLVPSDATNLVTAAMANQIKAQMRRSNLLVLGKVRSEFPKPFNRDQKPLAKFAAELLRPNCFPEEALVREMRAARVQDVWSATKFEAGEPIVRSGQVVTPLAKAALDELRVRMLAMRAQEPPSRPEWLVPAVTAGAAVVLLCGGIAFWAIRRRRSAMLALEVTAPNGISTDPVMRAQLMERMTRLLGETLVKRLFADRTHMLEAQSDATVQTEQMEQRLESIQSKVQQKYREYEDRIAQLETELASAEEEKRDLIRAKIVLAREELEAERAKNRLDWN